MSNEIENALINDNVEADPAKPYKMYAAIVSGFLVSLVASGLLNPWATAILTAFSSGIAVFLISNPLRASESVPIPPQDEDTLF